MIPQGGFGPMGTHGAPLISPQSPIRIENVVHEPLKVHISFKYVIRNFYFRLMNRIMNNFFYIIFYF